MKFIKLAENEGYKVKVYDPFVNNFEYVILSLEEAVWDSDCIVIITDHSKYEEIEPEEISKRMRAKNVVDSRTILDNVGWEKARFTVKVLGDGK